MLRRQRQTKEISPQHEIRQGISDLMADLKKLDIFWLKTSSPTAVKSCTACLNALIAFASKLLHGIRHWSLLSRHNNCLSPSNSKVLERFSDFFAYYNLQLSLNQTQTNTFTSEQMKC